MKGKKRGRPARAVHEGRMPLVSMHLPEAMIVSLDAMAKEQGTTRAALVRFAVDELLKVMVPSGHAVTV